MKKRIKRIAQKSNKKLQEMTGRMEVNLMLPIAEVLTATQWQIEQLAGAAGMKIIQQIIQDDVRQLAANDTNATASSLAVKMKILKKRFSFSVASNRP